MLNHFSFTLSLLHYISWRDLIVPSKRDLLEVIFDKLSFDNSREGSLNSDTIVNDFCIEFFLKCFLDLRVEWRVFGAIIGDMLIFGDK